jgi:hypothetical protein
MKIGTNLESIVAWSPAWMFRDAFQGSHQWLSHGLNWRGHIVEWDAGDEHPLELNPLGVPLRLRHWRTPSGRWRWQAAGVLFLHGHGAYPGGTYRVEWQGNGRIRFGPGARVLNRGWGPAHGRRLDVDVTPCALGIHLMIVRTDPDDPIRNLRVWMPGVHSGTCEAGCTSTQPASPFHPLYLDRLRPFEVLRFMEMQQVNTSTVREWSDRRTDQAVRQGSPITGTRSEPMVNGTSLEVMVHLCNDLGTDGWFNMPPMADDDYIRNFATQVIQTLHSEGRVYVEWANEIWLADQHNAVTRWVQELCRRPENHGLGHLSVAAGQVARSHRIWSEVFARHPQRLVRVLAGYAFDVTVTRRLLEGVGEAVDAIAIAPYVHLRMFRGLPPDPSVEQLVGAGQRALPLVLAAVHRHRRLAEAWSRRLGRAIPLLAYEGGLSLNPKECPVPASPERILEATNHPAMDRVYQAYLDGLARAGVALYVDYRFTGFPDPQGEGDYGRLHPFDLPLEAAVRYRALVAAGAATTLAGLREEHLKAGFILARKSSG